MPKVIELPCAERVLEKCKFQVYLSEHFFPCNCGFRIPLLLPATALHLAGRRIRDASEQGRRSPKTEMRDRTRLLRRGFGLVEQVPVRGMALGSGDQGFVAASFLPDSWQFLAACFL